MKLKKLSLWILILIHSYTYAHGALNSSPKIYAEIFGGIGSSNQFEISQYGTVFFLEAEGGPLAVNVFDNTNDTSPGLYGANIGFQWPNSMIAKWNLIPAIELEGYYLGKSTFEISAQNSGTRMLDRDWQVSYPTNMAVLLTNAVLGLDYRQLGKFRPYVGIGLGSALVSISSATANVTSPAEDLNHFGASSNDSSVTFAAQTKIGLQYNFTDYLGVFIEYRWLYVGSTSFEFGSTTSPEHATTSSWTVKMDPHYYNIGTLGLQFSI